MTNQCSNGRAIETRAPAGFDHSNIRSFEFDSSFVIRASNFRGAASCLEFPAEAAMRHLIGWKYLLQFPLVALAIWAFWPSAQTSSPAPGRRASLNPNAKYVLRVSPQLYTPGTMPQDVGQPLQGLNLVADDFEKL